MALNYCESCGSSFYVQDGQEWKRLCLPCWRANKRSEQGYWSPTVQLCNDLARAEAELTVARDRIGILEQALAQRANVELDPSMLRLLVQLTHPDKHNGSPAAAKAAAYLNDLRRTRR